MRRFQIILLLLAFAALPATAARAQFLSAEARASETPDAFAQRVAGLYGPEGEWAKAKGSDAFEPYGARVRDEVYDPAFKALLDDNRQLGDRWKIQDVDHDPLCQCQAVDVRVRVDTLDRRAPDLAEAHMASCEGPDSGCITYVLVLRRLAGGWRIGDVVEQGDGLRAILEKDNACMRAAGSQAELKRCWK